MNIKGIAAGLVALGVLYGVLGMSADKYGWEVIPSEKVPVSGTFYRMSEARNGVPGAPFPANVSSGSPVYGLGDTGWYVVDDRPSWNRQNSFLDAGWSSYRQALLLLWIEGQLSMESMTQSGSGGFGMESLEYNPLDYGSNMYLVATGVTNTNVYITAVNTTNWTYQLGSRTNLVTDSGWLFEQEFTGVANGSPLALNPVSRQGRSNLFFWAVHSDMRLRIARGEIEDEPPPDAIEPYPSTGTGGRPGLFLIQTENLALAASDILVHYRLSGTATNGVDYTNLTGTIILPQGEYAAYLWVYPKPDYLLEGDETIVATLTIGTNYLVDTNFTTAAIEIQDTILEPVADVPVPIGIDYHLGSNALIVSGNYNDDGNPNAFFIINSNGMVTNWSGVSNVSEEVKLATVKTSAGGFTNGDVFFSSGDGIGLITANGAVSNTNWCTLTNTTVTNALPLRGGLYVDQTGIFTNQLIAVTSDEAGSGALKGVWSIEANGTPHLVTTISTLHLEGVTTLPNDTNKYGSWAGKIITGDENENKIYAIATDGATVTNFTTNLVAGGIHPEDFDIIPTNQNLYACDPNGVILKASSNFFTNHVGDLLITQAGEGFVPALLFILHWNGSNFETVAIPYRPSGGNGRLEHITFAPIHIPNLTQ